MQRRTFLALALSVAGGTWLAGCGGGGSTNNPVGRGGATGFLFRSADGALRLFNTAAEGVAAGLTLASGVSAQIVGGAGSAAIGPDGRLSLTGLEAGLRTLRLTPGGSGAPKDIPLTVVPDAILPLGETPVNRQQAVAALQAQMVSKGISELFTEADVLVSATPLPAGVALAPAMPAGEEPLSIDRPCWVVYVDRAPGERFGHRTLIVLVDAVTGEIQGRDSQSWPTLNGASFYAESTVNATSPDAVQVATRRVVTRTAQAPSPHELQRVAVSSQAASCRAKDPDTSKTHVLMVQGFPRSDFAADIDSVDLLLSAAPFPALGTLRKVKTFESTESAITLFQREFAAMRDACESGDTFVLYVTSHGLINEEYPLPFSGPRGLAFHPVNPIVPTGDDVSASYRLALQTDSGYGYSFITDGSIVKADLLQPATLDFSDCKACRIVLWIDTCYSGNWIPLLRPQLEALEHKDILILTAANPQIPAQPVQPSAPAVVVGGETLFVSSGGAFSQTLMLGARRLMDTNPAETGADMLMSAFPFAFEATTSLNTSDGVDPQLPQVFRRALDPDDVCGRGNQEVTIK